MPFVEALGKTFKELNDGKQSIEFGLLRDKRKLKGIRPSIKPFYVRK